MGALCSKKSIHIRSSRLSRNKDLMSISNASQIHGEDLKHWKIWNDIDLRDEAKVLQLAIFMQTLLSVVERYNPSKTLEECRSMSCDIDFENIDLMDGFRLRWPVKERDVDAMINEFRENASTTSCRLDIQYMLKLIYTCIELYQVQPNIVYLEIPKETKITVVGDIHGQLYDMLHIFEENGYPSKDNWYLFNGDFIDRGQFSAEVAAILLAYKIIYPEYLHLNRGNHEDNHISRLYGFQREIHAKYDAEVYQAFCDFFMWLPIGHVINKKIFVLHGGLFHRDGVLLDELNLIPRCDYAPTLDISRQDEQQDQEAVDHADKLQLMRDLLWSDPMAEQGRAPSRRGSGVNFGPDVAERFMNDNGLDWIIRSHEPTLLGYQWPYQDKQVVRGNVKSLAKHALTTLFSCSNYVGAKNHGAYLTIDSQLNYQIKSYNIVCKARATEQISIEVQNRDNLIEMIVENKEELLQSFLAEDTEKTGFVELSRWGEIMTQVLDLSLDWKSVAHLLVDVDDRKRINFNDFLSSYKTHYQEKTGKGRTFDAIYTNRRQLEAIFRFFDMDGSGEISAQEFRKGCKILNRDLPKNSKLTNVDALFNELDIDRNQNININEFMEAFRIVDAREKKHIQSKKNRGKQNQESASFRERTSL